MTWGYAAPDMGTESFCRSRALRDQWYVVADAADIAVAPVGVTLLGDPYVVWRGDDGELA